MAGHKGSGGPLTPLSAELKVGPPLKFYKGVLLRWTPSLGRYGFFLGTMFLFFSDWKVFMGKLPYYNRKFEEKEPLV